MLLKISAVTERLRTQYTLIGLVSSVNEMCLQMTGAREVLVADCTLQWLRVDTAMQLQPTLGPVGPAALLTLQETGCCCLGEAHSD